MQHPEENARPTGTDSIIGCVVFIRRSCVKLVATTRFSGKHRNPLPHAITFRTYREDQGSVRHSVWITGSQYGLQELKCGHVRMSNQLMNLKEVFNIAEDPIIVKRCIGLPVIVEQDAFWAVILIRALYLGEG